MSRIIETLESKKSQDFWTEEKKSTEMKGLSIQNERSIDSHASYTGSPWDSCHTSWKNCSLARCALYVEEVYKWALFVICIAYIFQVCLSRAHMCINGCSLTAALVWWCPIHDAAMLSCQTLSKRFLHLAKCYCECISPILFVATSRLSFWALKHTYKHHGIDYDIFFFSKSPSFHSTKPPIIPHS